MDNVGWTHDKIRSSLVVRYDRTLPATVWPMRNICYIRQRSIHYTVTFMSKWVRSKIRLLTSN